MSVRRRTALIVVLALGGLSVVALARPGPGRIRGSVPPNGPVGDLTVVAARANLLTWTGEALSYRVERSADPSGPWSAVGATSSRSFADRPPERAIYWYRVSPLGAGGAAGTPTAPSSSDHVEIRGTIGPEGGVLRPSTGTVKLQVPAGAIPATTTFSITQLPSPPQPHAGVVVTRAFDIGPSGTRFDPPAILTLRADPPSGGTLPEDAAVSARSWDQAADRWTQLGTASFDPERSTVTTRIPHLSLWAAAATTLPHGGYGSDTDYCAACHASHDAADGTRLLNAPTEREVCYACHDATGASTDVRSAFGETTIGLSIRTSVHPVPAPAGGVQLDCSDCHTPHRPIAEDTALLRVLQADGSYRYSPPGTPIGDDFCYACHGAASSLPKPFGDHSTFGASVHGADGNVPLPPSGSGIRCLACHESHGSDYARLTTADQENLCYTCHTTAEPPSPRGTNAAQAFTTTSNDYSTTDGNPIRVYHHPISTIEQDAGSRVAECSSCHNVHVVDGADSSTGSLIIDPADTSSPWIVTWDPAAAAQTKGDIGNFCLRCHVNPSTTQPIAPGPGVPYTIRLVDDSAGTDADGTPHDTFAAVNWLNTSGHGPTGADLACTACHDPHGSSNAYLLREAMVSPDGLTENTVTGFTGLGGDAATLTTFCQTCHAALPTDAPHTDGTLCTECHSHGSGRF